MEHLKTIKIHPVHMQPGDTLSLTYSYEEPVEVWNTKHLNLDSVTEPTTVDTVIVYKINNEFGLKAGRALLLGEDDGTHRYAPFVSGLTIDKSNDRTIGVATK